MKQVRIHGAGDVRVDEVPGPVPGPADAVVAVAACGICGTDLSFVEYGPMVGRPGEPLPIGHEIAGTILEVGAEVTGLRPGDRVVVFPGNDALGRIGCGAEEGGLASRLLVREAELRLHRIPDGLDLEVAALAEPLAVGMNAADQTGAVAGDSAAIFGCGPVGLAALASLIDRGVTRVVAIDPSARRRALALELGAEEALDPEADDVWARLAARHGEVATLAGPAAGTDVYVEASGVGAVLSDIVAHAGPGATVSIVAVHHAEVPISALLVMMKQLTLRGAMEYPARFSSAIELLARRDLSAIATHRVPVAEFDRALALLQGSKDCGKVLITFPEAGDE